MTESNTVSTQLDPNAKLQKSEEPFNECEPKSLYSELVSLILVRQSNQTLLLLSATWASSITVTKKIHWTAAERVLRYLKGTINLGLVYSSDEDYHLKGFVDSDCGSCLDDRKFYTGYSFILCRSPISWDAKNQRTSHCHALKMSIWGCLKQQKKQFISGIFWTIWILND